MTGQKPLLLGRQELDSSGLCQRNLSTSNKQVNGLRVGWSKHQNSSKLFSFWEWVDESYFKKLPDSTVNNSVNTGLVNPWEHFGNELWSSASSHDSPKKNFCLRAFLNNYEIWSWELNSIALFLIFCSTIVLYLFEPCMLLSLQILQRALEDVPLSKFSIIQFSLGPEYLASHLHAGLYEKVLFLVWEQSSCWACREMWFIRRHRVVSSFALWSAFSNLCSNRWEASWLTCWQFTQVLLKKTFAWSPWRKNLGGVDQSSPLQW